MKDGLTSPAQRETESDEERENSANAFDAIRYDDIGKLETLVHGRADIIDRNNKNNTLLHCAVEKGNKKIVELLLLPKWKVNIHAKNIVGNTPLHIAALKNNAELVRLLLSKGANSDIENDEGEMPLDMAREPVVISLLESADGTSQKCGVTPKSVEEKDVDKPSQQDKEYEKREGTTAMRSHLYKIKLATLYLLHGLVGIESKRLLSFRLASNMEGVDRVGDLVFECRYKEPNGTEKSKITIVHSKHKDKMQETDALGQQGKQQRSAANERGSWVLMDHLRAYRRIKNKYAGMDCELIIFTNVPFHDFFKGYKIHVTKEAVERQSIFDFTGTHVYCQLSIGEDEVEEIAAMVNPSSSSGKKLPSLKSSETEDDVREYCKNLKIFCEQPNESELRAIISDKIRSIYRVSPKDVNRVFVDVEYKMTSWWIHGNEYLTEDNRFFQDSARASIHFGVKDPVVTFMGRHVELDELHRSLQRAQGLSNRHVTSQMTCVTGLGGIGKTQLAREYIKQYSRSYDDNVIWMNAESNESLHREFRRLAQDKLNIATENAHQKDKDISSLVAETYLFFAKRRSLFVFDNADKTGILTAFLPMKLPANAERPHILITSRRNEWYDGVDVIKLGEFTRREAARFVRKNLGLDEKNDAMDRSIIRLVEVLQRFPLAIQQAISYIKNQSLTADMSIDEYLKIYEQSKQVLLDWKPVTKDTSIDYERTTYTTWRITIEKIGETRIGKLALEILDVIAHLAPNDIRREMFSTLALDNDPDLRAAVRTLVNFSLINGEQRQSILHVHKLVQQVTRLEQIMRGTETEIFRKSWGLLEHNLRSVDGHENCVKKIHILLHCEAMLLRLDDVMENPHDSPRIKDDNMVFTLDWMSRFFFCHGYTKRSQELKDRILGINEKRYGRDDPRLIPILEEVGMCYKYLSDPQNAKRSIERILEIRERQSGHDDLAIVDTLVEMGDICEALADHLKQKQFIGRALDIVEKQDPCNYSEISHLSYKLAFAYGHLGDHRKQNELVERALRITEKHQPRELFETEREMTMLFMNQAHCHQRGSATSIDILERALFLARTHYGGNHYKICKFFVKLSIMNSGLRNQEIQEKLMDRAADILVTHGDDCFREAVTLVSFAVAHGSLGDFYNKRVLGQRAPGIHCERHSPEQIGLGNTLLSFGDASERLHNLRDQMDLSELVLNTTGKQYGPDTLELSLILAELNSGYECG